MNSVSLKYCLINKIPFRIRFKESIGGFHKMVMEFNLLKDSYSSKDGQEVSSEFYNKRKELFEQV